MSSKNMKVWWNKHSVSILAGAGIGMGVGAVATTVTGTIKTVRQCDLVKADIEEKIGEPVEHLKPKDVFKICWKNYILPASLLIGSSACTIGIVRTTSKQKAELLAGIAAANSTIREYKQVTEEVVGKEKANEIKNKIKEKSEAAKQEIVKTNPDDIMDMWLLDYHGRPFRGNPNDIERDINKFNLHWMQGMSQTESINELYDWIDRPHVPYGDYEVWDINKDKLVDVYWTADNYKNRACLKMNFYNMPHMDNYCM